MTTAEVLFELHRRRQGYLFKGPTQNWCQPEGRNPDETDLSNKGCFKYEKCDLLTEEEKKTAWKDLSMGQKENLRKINCYRATLHKSNNSIDQPDTTWDETYLEERKKTPWVGNPFGIRNKNAPDISEKLRQKKYQEFKHRDIRPCSRGGCITPEMRKEARIADNEWQNAEACPFYFRATDELFSRFEKNISRFAQCFVTQKEVFNLLRDNKYISSASLFRDTAGSQNIFWYPYFSGYSFVQMLCLPNDSLLYSKADTLQRPDPGWTKVSPPLRWHATTAKRLSQAHSQANLAMFTKCEGNSDDHLTPKYMEQRILDVCDGYASFALLTWILACRKKSDCLNVNRDDICSWEYEKAEVLYSKLHEVGFTHQLNNNLSLSKEDLKIVRKSSIMEDMKLLGLIGADNKETAKFTHLITWLKKPEKYHDKDLQALIGRMDDQHSIKCKIIAKGEVSTDELLDIFTEFVNNKLEQDNNWNYSGISVLNPPLHIIVRAYLETPIRWCFIPANTELNNDQIKVTSGIILLIEDSLKSKAYEPEIEEGKNDLLKRVTTIFPLLSAINAIEEQNLRDELEKKEREALIEKERFAKQSAVSQVMARNMSHNIGSHVMNSLINTTYLENFSSGKADLKGYQPELDLEETEQHVFSQLARFNNYIKCRMDYLSDISFGTPIMQTSKSVFTDVFSELDKVRLLLDNISGLGDGFPYKIKFLVKKDGGQFKPLTSITDFNLAFPNDVLGIQAFYNIIEAVIRNTAKYAENKPRVTEIIVRFSNISDAEKEMLSETQYQEAEKLMCVEIYDTVDLSVTADKTSKYNKRIKKGEYPDLDSANEELINNIETGKEYDIPFINWLVFQQNKKLNMGLLDSSSYRLRNESLGLIEMSASAAYLRKLDIDLIDDKKYKLKQDNGILTQEEELSILKAIKVEEEEKHHLGYRFYLLKPQQVLIVLKKIDTITKTRRELLRKNGIEIITIDKFRKHVCDSSGVFAHEFLIYQGLEKETININNKDEKVLEYFSTSFSIRKIKLTDTLLSILKTGTANKIVDKCWTFWGSMFAPPFEEFLITGSNKEESDCIVLLDHLYSSKDRNRYIKNNFEAFYVEAITSNAMIRLPGVSNYIKELQNPDELLNYYLYKIQDNKRLQYQIAEGAFYEVLIIDERIQMFSTQEYMGVKYGELYEKMKVILPPCEINLSEKEFTSKENAYFETILKSQEGRNKPFIIVHYGLLERNFNNQISKSVAIHDYLNKLSKNYYVIVTSGRGTPKELPRTIRFVNHSAIINAFINLRLKYVITQLVFSSRKPLI